MWVLTDKEIKQMAADKKLHEAIYQFNGNPEQKADDPDWTKISEALIRSLWKQGYAIVSKEQLDAMETKEGSTIPGGYNYAPPGWTEITESEFSMSFFMYVKKKPMHRQIQWGEDGTHLPYTGSSYLFEISYAGWEGMGLAMTQNSKDGVRSIRYHRFGEPERWKKLASKFAAQFAGDNS